MRATKLVRHFSKGGFFTQEAPSPSPGPADNLYEGSLRFSEIIKKENYSISRLIKNDPPSPQDEQTTVKEYKTIAKTPAFAVERQKYFEIMKQYYKGRVNVFTYKNARFTLVGTPYDLLPPENAYKLLLNIQPDIIFTQVKPESVVPKFDYYPKKLKKDEFSSNLYFSQLKIKGSELLNSYPNLRSILKKSKHSFFIDSLSQLPMKSTSMNQKRLPSQDRIDGNLLAAASLWSMKKGVDIVAGDLPEFINRYNILNSMTLAQLQNLLTNASNQLGKSPDLLPKVPIAMAPYLLPEIFMEASDRYIATVFEYLVHRGYKNIIGFCGHIQNESVQEYLENRNVSHFSAELKPATPYKTIVREVSLAEIVDKLSIIDVLNFGPEAAENYEKYNFELTLRIVENFSKQIVADTKLMRRMQLLHRDLVKKYAGFVDNHIAEGRVELRREFMKQVRI